MTEILSRRHVLRWAGLQLSLPLLAGIATRDAPAAPVRRSNFIAGYFPNGAHMPHGQNGNWTFDDALSTLGDLRESAMVVRGLYNGFPGIDPHWQNCAGFLSCHPIELGDPGVARCAKSFDQFVADARPSPLHSLEIGGLYYHQHLLNDHPGYSHDYLNRISWQTADQFRSPVADPVRLFDSLFSTGDADSAALLEYIRSRRASVLDHLHQDASRLSSRLPGEYRPVLDSYMTTVRELEGQLTAPTMGCSGAPERPTGEFPEPNKNYMERFRLMHQMTVIALQCGLTQVATLMYAPAVADGVSLAEELGPGGGLHGYAHHGGTQERIDRLKQINLVQVELMRDLLEKLRSANLLADTLVVFGSDMSDGDIHHTENLPFLLCGAGDDLKFGSEVGTPEARRPLSDLYVEVARLLEMNDFSSFGSGVCASTGAPLGLERV